ncbi:fat storage-inducing transmembrane protein [Contarinia nasturtii]|uniref:fat storage-inducing transmembrane protein n=1 Tax=Contarinia nasturtii TaxID=265458 RepID=UPI0012D3DD3D|nr:fat storage-inducing transmembrane protein [Contarinia nasturtii]
MASKRKMTSSSTNMNFRPTGYDPQRQDTKGTRPTSNPTTVREVLLQVLMFLCKKIIFFDVNLKVALYLGSLFLVSLIGDFAPYPKTYFARSDNIFNVYFVKWGWAWTLVLSVPYLVLTSFILCCGNRGKLFKEHLPRIVIATFFWLTWTKAFNFIETMYGRCNAKGVDTKIACLKGGHFWHGFDISGHAFILIYSSLVLIEEAKPIIGWENIKEHLRNEDHNRNTREDSSSNPLRNLEDDEFQTVKEMYEKYTPLIRILFISMTALQLLWDVMLVCTMLYYHKMIEKVLSGIFAILTWFFTYRAWYPAHSLLPNSVGHGKFLYQKVKPQPAVPFRKQSLNYGNAGPSNRSNDVPKFMGMPIYQQKPVTVTTTE